MTIPTPPSFEEKAEPRTNSELSLYDNLITWYTSKSVGVHMAALVVGLLLLLFELVGFIVDPPYMMKLASSTECNIPGYGQYTPTIWLAGVFTGLLLFFVMRYSHVYQMRQRAKHLSDTFIMPKWAQHFAIESTLLVILVEVVLIAKTKWTISSLSRGAAIAHPWLYWIFGIVAAGVVFITTDLKRLPRIVRLSLALWVAILAHIFWWITP